MTETLIIVAAIITMGFWIVNALEQIDKDIRQLIDIIREG